MLCFDKGKPVNLGDGDEMQVPCSLNFTGRKKFIDILEKTLKLYVNQSLWINIVVKCFTFFSIGVAIQ